MTLPNPINIVPVKVALCDLLIPITEHVANLMGRPRVIVNRDTIDEACIYMLGEQTPESVAQYLALQTGYRVQLNGRWDWFYTKTLPEKFDPIEPQDDPTCPICGHHNAMQITDKNMLRCRDCNHMMDIIMTQHPQQFTFTIHFTTECNEVLTVDKMCDWVRNVFIEQNDMGRVDAMCISEGHNPVGNYGKRNTYHGKIV